MTPELSFDGNMSNVKFTRSEEQDERIAVSLPKGSQVLMDIWGVHMNRTLSLLSARQAKSDTILIMALLALVWGPDAHLFRPEHFIDTEDYRWPRDGCMHIPFPPFPFQLILIPS